MLPFPLIHASNPHLFSLACPNIGKLALLFKRPARSSVLTDCTCRRAGRHVQRIWWRSQSAPCRMALWRYYRTESQSTVAAGSALTPSNIDDQRPRDGTTRERSDKPGTVLTLTGRGAAWHPTLFCRPFGPTNRLSDPRGCPLAITRAQHFHSEGFYDNV